MRAFAVKPKLDRPEAQLGRAAAGGEAVRGFQTGQPEYGQERSDTRGIGRGDSIQGVIPPIVHEVLSSPGRSLDGAVRAFMEPRFGHDFSQVRVHADTKAAESARAVSALAYTAGQNMVFGESKYEPNTRAGRELLAHELAHTIQQRHAGGAPADADRDNAFEASANEAARNVANGGNLSRSLPACGHQIQRSLDTDPRWKNSVRAARYRGQAMANRIKKHGILSKDARAQINKELAYFEGEAKKTYQHEIQPILWKLGEIELAEQGVKRKPPSVTGFPMLPPDPRQFSDEDIYKPLAEAKQKEQEAEEAERQGELEKLREMTKKWGSDQEFALALLEPILKAKLNPDPRGVAAAIRKPILARYEIWLRDTDKKRSAACQQMPGGVVGFIMKSQAKWQPTLDPCRSWFTDEYSHGPQELQSLERLLKIRGVSSDATNTVYWSVREYRMKTDPLMLEQEQMASEMISGVAGLGRVPGEVTPTVVGAGETAAKAPDLITPSRPVAGFGRDIEPAPQPVPAPDPYVKTQMPRARVVQGNQPTYGSVKPALETEGQGAPAKPSPRVQGFRPPPKDIAEKPGFIEVEMGPREYVRKEYLGDVGPGGEQQARYYANVQLDERGMMDADFVLRGGGKRSGQLIGKDEFLAAKQHFEQQNGAGSVKGAYGKWGGGDNLDTFNTRYKVATDKGLPPGQAMIEAARKTKTGEWAKAAGFDDVRITKAEGSPGKFTDVEVEFTKKPSTEQ